MAGRYYAKVSAACIETALCGFGGDFHVRCGPAVFSLRKGRVDVTLPYATYVLRKERRPELHSEIWEVSVQGYECRVMSDFSGGDVQFEVIDHAADPMTGYRSSKVVYPAEDPYAREYARCFEEPMSNPVLLLLAP